jgi:ribose transport system substrate-binding protein
MKASRDFNVVVTFDGLEKDSSADRQVDVLSTVLAKNPSALCIDALDSTATVALLQQAQKQKIPVIGFDVGVNGFVAVTTVATDNAAAAALAAHKMAALIGGYGKVGLIVCDRTSRAAVDRADGFRSAMRKKHPEIQILGPQYSSGDAQTSYDLAKNIMTANPDLKGFFGADEVSVSGVLRAVQERDMAGRVTIVGFGSGKVQVDAIRGMLMAGAITQDPIRIGYKAVEAAVRILSGQKVPRTIDAGFHWYDQTNIDDPVIAVLLDQ